MGRVWLSRLDSDKTKPEGDRVSDEEALGLKWKIVPN